MVEANSLNDAAGIAVDLAMNNGNTSFIVIEHGSSEHSTHYAVVTISEWENMKAAIKNAPRFMIDSAFQYVKAFAVVSDTVQLT